MSVSGGGRCLLFSYQISSPRLELVFHASKTSRAQQLKYTDQEHIGRWNSAKLVLYSDAEAVQLVARKTGVTTNVEYVLIDGMSIDSCHDAESGGYSFCQSICAIKLQKNLSSIEDRCHSDRV